VQKRRATPEGYVSRFIERAKESTPDTDLDRDFLIAKIAPGACELTGVAFSYDKNTNYYSNPKCPSIDRIDSSKGYYKDNVQIVLNWINRAKNEYSMQDFSEMLLEAANALKVLDLFPAFE
jgi:hypothetical protein